MKKFIMLLAAGAMALTLSACDGDKKPKEPDVQDNAAMQPKAGDEKNMADDKAKPDEMMDKKEETKEGD